VYIKLTLNSQSFCFHLPSIGITGMNHQAQLKTWNFYHQWVLDFVKCLSTILKWCFFLYSVNKRNQYWKLSDSKPT
jgi:hypothetical protein